MKIPSFVRLPNYKRFGFEPRYYDPIKEEIAERTARIKREMNGEAGDYVPSRIVFERKQTAGNNASFLQLIIAAGLGGITVGWLYFGNSIFYALWLLVPVYLYFRLRNRFFKK